MKARIDRDGCIGCGLCEQTAPEVFRMSEDGLADVIGDEVPAGSEEGAVEAAENCPVGVIHLD